MYETLEQALKEAAKAIAQAEEYFEEAHGDDVDMQVSVALLFGGIAQARRAITEAIAFAEKK